MHVHQALCSALHAASALHVDLESGALTWRWGADVAMGADVALKYQVRWSDDVAVGCRRGSGVLTRRWGQRGAALPDATWQ